MRSRERERSRERSREREREQGGGRENRERGKGVQGGRGREVRRIGREKEPNVYFSILCTRLITVKGHITLPKGGYS